MFDFPQFWQCEKAKYTRIQLHLLFFWGFNGLQARCTVFNSVKYFVSIQNSKAANPCFRGGLSLEKYCSVRGRVRCNIIIQIYAKFHSWREKENRQCSHKAPSLYISFVYLLSKYTNTGAISSLFPSQMMARLEELVEREDPEETWLAWVSAQQHFAR